MLIGVVYRINVYALVAVTHGEDHPPSMESSTTELESKELHAKLVLNEKQSLEVYNEEQHQLSHSRA